MSHSSPGAVFLSYASQDGEAVRRLAEALRGAGVEVWFDWDELRGGDEWDRKIRQQIKTCALFVPVLSANTQSRPEGYFRLEWHLAEQRSLLIAKGRAFIVPVCIDETREGEALVPDAFLAVQWSRLRQGRPASGGAAGGPGSGGQARSGTDEQLTQFVAQVQRLLVQPQAASPQSGVAPASTPTGRNVRRPRRWQIIAPAAAVLVGLAAVVWKWQRPAPSTQPDTAAASVPASTPAAVSTKSIAVRPARPPSAAAEPAQAAQPAQTGKSLVVLPLENLSPDPADAFFTDGMHEEIVQTLSRLGDLRVLSRATALTLKGTKDSLAAIGQRLGVAYALSGSLRRGGKQVRVSVELRRTADEGVVWQKRFEQEFKDGFALQDEIAAEVAKVLQVHTSAGWFAGAKFMTKNAEAYELFLKARDLPATKGPSPMTFREQVALGERVMALDPNFMSGASLLSQAYTYLFTSSRGTLGQAERTEIADKAKRWAERASALMPGAGDGALAVYYSMAEQNPERALVYAQNEVRALPNDPNGYNRLGSVASWGRYREALEAYNRALALDPMHVRALYNRVRVAAYLRDLPAFEEAAAKSLEHGGMNVNRYEIFEYRFNLTGKLPDGLYRYPDSIVGDATILWLGRRFEELLAEADRLLTKPGDLRLFSRFLALTFRARAAQRLGRPAVTADAVSAMVAIAETEAESAGLPERQLQWMKVTVLAYTGRKDEAIALCRRQIEASAAPAQTSVRWGWERDLALIHAWFGDKRECVEVLARLLLVPSGVTVVNLRLAADWDLVRDDAGFQALLADPRNSAPL
ncbi:MAG: TIR domain-containing protein [Verrucomicrobia bacterium]|nr:TIR domain-containing protein [Verrucomicrobiota bacterium]